MPVIRWWRLIAADGGGRRGAPPPQLAAAPPARRAAAPAAAPADGSFGAAAPAALRPRLRQPTARGTAGALAPPAAAAGAGRSRSGCARSRARWCASSPRRRASTSRSSGLRDPRPGDQGRHRQAHLEQRQARRRRAAVATAGRRSGRGAAHDRRRRLPRRRPTTPSENVTIEPMSKIRQITARAHALLEGHLGARHHGVRHGHVEGAPRRASRSKDRLPQGQRHQAQLHAVHLQGGGRGAEAPIPS